MITERLATTSSNLLEIDFIIEKKDLKVVAFKISDYLQAKIKNLCETGFYVSLSEVTRIAIIEFIAELLELKMNGSTWFESPKDEYVKNKKVSTSVKIPINLLNIMSDIIYDFHFKNRSVFIRIALSRFLEVDQEIYPRIKKKIRQIDQF